MFRFSRFYRICLNPAQLLRNQNVKKYYKSMTAKMMKLIKRPLERDWSFVALILGAVGIAFAPIFVRLSELGPNATAFYRLALAFPILLLGVRISSQPVEAIKCQWLTGVALASAGIFFAADLAVWHWSIQLTSVANATLLANFAPIFVVLGSWLLWGQRFTSVFLMAIGLVMVGAILLMSASLNLDFDHLLGDGLGVLTAVFYASYMLAVARLRSHFSTFVIAACTCLIGAFILLIITVVVGESLMPQTVSGWWVLLALALIPQVAGQSLITYALAHLPAAFSSVSLLLQPVIASCLAWWLFDEGLNYSQVLGGGVIFLGIILARHYQPAS